MLIESRFRAPWWCRNRHLQTLWAPLFKRLKPLPKTQRQRIELDDGDFIDVDFCGDEHEKKALILHGLEGSIDSHYIRNLIWQLIEHQIQPIVMHFRSCSGESNRLARSYHSGASDDLEQVYQWLSEQGKAPAFLAGFSLGGNVLLKWLGEKSHQSIVEAAVAVSVPLLLDVCATAIDSGFSRLYQSYLLTSLRNKTHSKLVSHNLENSLSLKQEQIARLKNFWQFDHHVTAPLHGFESAEDYYQKASSRQFLKAIDSPTLIIQAKDDPFMFPEVIPELHELGSKVCVEVSPHGGHVGFVGGDWPWKAKYYLEHRITEFFLHNRSRKDP